MSLAFVTSWNTKLVESGEELIRSYKDTCTNNYSIMYCGLESISLGNHWREVNVFDFSLNRDPVLKEWLRENKDIIPVELGGKLEKTLPWFNRHASRWFRKAVCLDFVIKNFTHDYVVWIDADCEFLQQITLPFVRDILFDEDRADVFYMRGIRPVMEAGIFGYNLKRKGIEFFNKFFELYLSGQFKDLQRWDDSYLLQYILMNEDFYGFDLVQVPKTGGHASVVEHSLVGKHITHYKGTHGRIKGIYT